MMYNYPFFSFPHFRKYPNYYSVPYSCTSQKPINKPYYKEISDNQTNQFKGQYNHSNYSNLENKYINKQRDKYSTCLNKQQKEGDFSKKTPSGFSFLNNIFHQEDRENDEEYFDLFGLKLYHDDILLIGLIFFLYKEDVKDQYLFFALILLLLS